MKQFAKYIFLAILFCSMALTGQSRTFRIDISKMQDDLPMELRKFCEKVTYADTIFLNFGKGTYRIDATVECKCHVILRGESRENTKIVFAHGRNRNNLKAYTSDAFFKFDGTPAHPISVSISDIAFDIEQHEGILWKEAERYAVKIYHARVAHGVMVHGIGIGAHDDDFFGPGLAAVIRVLVGEPVPLAGGAGGGEPGVNAPVGIVHYRRPVAVAPFAVQRREYVVSVVGGLHGDVLVGVGVDFGHGVGEQPRIGRGLGSRGGFFGGVIVRFHVV